MSQMIGARDVENITTKLRVLSDVFGGVWLKFILQLKIKIFRFIETLEVPIWRSFIKTYLISNILENS